MGKAVPVQKKPGTQKMTDGRLPADLMRSLRPSIQHYSPAMLLAEALRRLAQEDAA
jgi:hypothetical protein